MLSVPCYTLGAGEPARLRCAGSLEPLKPSASLALADAHARPPPLLLRRLVPWRCCCSGKGEGILLTPFAAGHLIGGTVWRVRKGGEDYVYAVDYNHR